MSIAKTTLPSEFRNYICSKNPQWIAHYPVLRYPSMIISFNAEKTKIIEGELSGIKYTDALNQAKNLLFSVGRPENIQQACEEFYQNVQKGKMDEGHSLTIHRDYLNDLPALLRVYIGCATQLYGDIENADLIKIHIRSGKISLMRHDDFEGKPLPLLPHFSIFSD